MSNPVNNGTGQHDQAGKDPVASSATRNDEPKNRHDDTEAHPKGEDESKGETLTGGKFPQQ